jgi:hypothetical protein
MYKLHIFRVKSLYLTPATELGKKQAAKTRRKRNVNASGYSAPKKM